MDQSYLDLGVPPLKYIYNYWQTIVLIGSIMKEPKEIKYV